MGGVARPLRRWSGRRAVCPRDHRLELGRPRGVQGHEERTPLVQAAAAQEIRAGRISAEDRLCRPAARPTGANWRPPLGTRAAPAFRRPAGRRPKPASDDAHLGPRARLGHHLGFQKSPGGTASRARGLAHLASAGATTHGQHARPARAVSGATVSPEWRRADHEQTRRGPEQQRDLARHAPGAIERRGSDSTRTTLSSASRWCEARISMSQGASKRTPRSG